MQGMASFFYLNHYNEVISPKLTNEQKEDIARRISELTLRSPIWLETDTDYIVQFPELKGLISHGAKLTGFYLCTIMDGIMADLNPGHVTFAEQTVGPPLKQSKYRKTGRWK